MALTTTTLINTDEYATDLRSYGIENIEHFLNADGETVEVLAESADGYWDIRIANGMVFGAMSWDMLEGFTENTTTKTETAVTVSLVGFKPKTPFKVETYNPRERFMNTAGERARQSRSMNHQFASDFGGCSDNYNR